MKKLININYKNIIRSYWPIFYYSILLAFFILSQYILDYFNVYTLGAWSRGNSYGDVLFLIVNYFLGVYSIQSIDDFDLTLYISNNKLIFSKFFPCLIFSFKFIIFNMIYIYIKGSSFGYSVYYLLNIILNLFIIQFSVAIVGISSGFAIGSIFKNKMSYVLVIIPVLFFSTFFNNHIFGYGFEKENIASYFSILEDNPDLYFQTSIGNVFDIKYFIDKIFPFSISIIFMALTSIMVWKKKIFKKLIVLFSGFILLVLGLYLNFNYDYGYKYSLLPENQETRNERLLNYNSDLEIKDISMDLIINEILENKIEIILTNPTSNKIDFINFYLNDNFDIINLTVDDLLVDVYRNENDLKIPLNIQPGEVKNIKINYKGRLKERLNTGSLLFYSSKNSSNLVYSMNWYPLINLDKEIDFDIKVNHNNKLICNLNNFNIIEEGSSVIKGKSKYVYLSTGFYEELEYNDIKYVGSEEIIKKYLKNYDSIIKHSMDNFQLDTKPEKIIIYPGIYLDVFMIDDLLMISESSIL